MELICVAPERVAEFWPFASHLIREAIERTDLSDFADIERHVLSGDQLLWIAWNGEAIEAAATTHLIRAGMRSLCILTACSGKERERWLHLFEKIEQYARNEGCCAMRIYGRRGWERVLEGYKTEYVILEKQLGRH